MKLRKIRINTANLGRLILLIGGLVLVLNCKEQSPKNQVLAQVGAATLTLADLRASFPAEFEPIIRREQYLDFIKRWIDDEVIYQQAQKAELEKDSAIVRKLAKVKRKLLIEEFLAKENSSEVFEPDEMSLNQYYEMHKENFKRKTLEARFIHFRVNSLKQANEFRAKIIRSDFFSVAAANSLDPIPESESAIGFKKPSEFPMCLSQEISKSTIGVVTSPITCPDGFYLIKVLERQEAGNLIPLVEAKEEIAAVLIMERKDKLLESRVAKYKDGIAISFNLDQIPGQIDAMPSAESKSPDSAIQPTPIPTVKQPSAPVVVVEVQPTPPSVEPAPIVKKKPARRAAAKRTPLINDSAAVKSTRLESSTEPSFDPSSAPTPSATPAIEEEKNNAQ